METHLVALSNELAGLAARVSPSVAVVEGRPRGTASGVHWRKNLVVAAEHSIQRDEDLSLVLPDGTRVPASLAGRDPGTDIALLKADNLSLPVLDTAPAVESRVGDVVLVIGRSPNSGPNASMGIISAVSGPWRTWRGGQLEQYLRLDAALFPGSSGGAVVDYNGRIVGMATSALSRVAGLAIPSATINRVVDLLLEKGGVPQGYLGLSLQPVRLPESLQKKTSAKGATALMVYSVEPAGPAEQAGILICDILLEIEGSGAGSIEELQAALGWDRIGKPVRTSIIRGGELQQKSIVVGQRKSGERK